MQWIESAHRYCFEADIVYIFRKDRELSRILVILYWRGAVFINDHFLESRGVSKFSAQRAIEFAYDYEFIMAKCERIQLTFRVENIFLLIWSLTADLNITF